MLFLKLVTVVCNDFDSDSRSSLTFCSLPWTFCLHYLSPPPPRLAAPCSATANYSEQYTIKQQRQNQTKIRNSMTCTHLRFRICFNAIRCMHNPNNAKWYYFIMRTVLLHAEKILFMYFNHQVGMWEDGAEQMHMNGVPHIGGDGTYNKPFRQQ